MIFEKARVLGSADLLSVVGVPRRNNKISMNECRGGHKFSRGNRILSGSKETGVGPAQRRGKKTTSAHASFK